MMFRKLHWVAERMLPEGCSEVFGVYTSLPDLLRHGLQEPQLTRLTLTSLDTEDGRVGTWSAPRFDGIETALDKGVRDEDFTREHTEALLHRLRDDVARAA